MANNQNASSIWKAALSILGIIVGVYLSFLYGQETNRREMLADQRVSAYVQYVEAHAMWKKLKNEKGNKEEVLKQEALRNAARFRSAIYGSKAVLSAWKFLLMAKPNSKESKEATVSWFQAMRNEIVPERDRVSDETLHVLLFLK